MSKYLILLSLFALTACEATKITPPQENLSSNLIALAFGKSGNDLNSRLDDLGRKHVYANQNKALEFSPSNNPYVWANSDNTLSGTIVVQQVISIGQRPCRDYMHTITFNKKVSVLKGTSCRNSADSTWKAQ